MLIQQILREIAIEDITIEEYNLGNVDTIIQQKTRKLDLYYKKKAMERVVSQYYYNHFNKLIMEERVEDILPLFTEIKNDIKSLDEKTNYIFVNVNPAPNHSLDYFHKLIHKAMSKKWVKDYLFVFEQRGENETEMGKGFHTHIILEKLPEKQYCQCIKELARTLAPVCDTSNYHLFSGAIIKESDINKRREYILGVKSDPTKHLKQQMDIIWRKENCLKPYYGNVNICLKKD